MKKVLLDTHNTVARPHRARVLGPTSSVPATRIVTFDPVIIWHELEELKFTTVKISPGSKTLALR
jgi:hypothetical protein